MHLYIGINTEVTDELLNIISSVEFMGRIYEMIEENGDPKVYVITKSKIIKNLVKLKLSELGVKI